MLQFSDKTLDVTANTVTATAHIYYDGPAPNVFTNKNYDAKVTVTIPSGSKVGTTSQI